MPRTRKPVADHGGKKGNFAESRNGLLMHFADGDGCAERSWRESFGYERRREKSRAQPFIAHDARRRSSEPK